MTRRAAVIGCGLIGRRRAHALVALGVDVGAVYDPYEARASETAHSLPETCRIARSEAEALEGADLAVIATPHVSLAPCAIEAVKAGCDVLIEKPGADGLAPLEDVASAATTSGRTVRVGYNHRFHPAVLEARSAVASGFYGPVLYVRARYGHGGRPGYEKEWRADRLISGGGELLDQGSHLVDLTRYLMGDVSLAFAELPTFFWNMAVEDNAFLALRGSAGGFAWLHASWTEWKNLFSLEVMMETAKVEVRGLGGSYGVESFWLHEMLPEMGPPVTSAKEWPRGDDSWALETADVLAAIDGEESDGAGIDDAVAVMRIIDAAYER